MQMMQSQAIPYFVGVAFFLLTCQCVPSVSGFSRNGVPSTSQAPLNDRAAFSSHIGDTTNEPFGSDPLQTSTPPPEELPKDELLGDKTPNDLIPQDADAKHESSLQWRHTELHLNGRSPTLSGTAKGPAEAASTASSASVTSAGAAWDVSAVGSEDLHLPSPRQRTQEISAHRFDAVKEASSVQRSLLGNKGTPAGPTGSPFVWTWNPLNAGTEPTEAESLEHEGVPEDFVGIPILDKAAEQQTEQAEDAATAAEAPAGEDSSAPSSSSTPSSGEAVEENQGGSNRRRSSGEYQRRFEERVAESRYGAPSHDESPSASSQDNDQIEPDPNLVSNSTLPQAPDAVPLDGPVWEPESGSVEQGSATGSSDYSSSTVGNRSSDSSTSNSSSSTTSEDSLYTPLEPLISRRSRWKPREAGEAGADEEAEESVGLKTECLLEVEGVRINASYVNSACTGPINVAYQRKQGKFMERQLLLSNTTDQPLTVVMKTVNAKFKASAPVYDTSYYRGFSGPFSFLQGQEGSDTDPAAAAATEAKTEDYISSMLKQMRRHRRKHPTNPLDLVVCFTSPLDGKSEEKGAETEGEAVSFMQTSAGATRIKQTCEELLSVLEERKGFSCEILEAVDIVILQFPPNADLSDTGEVKKVLSKLLLLEGKSILFFELAKPTSLQMVPVEEGLPEPPRRLMESWAFVQAKEALKEQCSAEATARTRLLSEEDDSPVAAHLPEDPDLEERLWGMYSAHCTHAWLHGEKGHREVVVAVIDSGVADHYDLNENIWHNPLEKIDGQDDDNNGFVDDTEGWNFANDTNAVVDGNGHGTHVAGTIGGVANGRDVVGCAPHVSLMKIQQFGPSGTGSIGDAVRGLAYAMREGVSVINNSWGATETTASLQLLMERSQYMRGGLGILIVNAAGNSSSNNDLQPFYPAGFDYKNTISVGAHDAEGNLASFSNFGKGSVSLLAPGERIYSTYLNKGFTFLSGTSMATPHVSGVAALVFGVFKKANSDVTAAEVKDIIKASVQPLESAKETTQWGGAVDAAAAVLMARMGGMWMQMKCTDMIVDLEPKEEYASTLYLRGYAQGIYSTDIKVEVYDKEGRLMGSAVIPITLNSSTTPETNKPTDAEAASAFSSYAKERNHQTPLCAVQLNYTGSLEDGGWTELQIAAVSLGCIAGALLLAVGGYLIYTQM
ncbi:subtilisin-like protease TgSUB2, putative [Eimeria praecox]|uniref:subtilisin n=1 Tax=Eimeria praecox TaxID=51316 RepID=U6H316_9EIME|nr:subtilisin-like protease TgSUB2, putative [Eimeria praecox]